MIGRLTAAASALALSFGASGALACAGPAPCAYAPASSAYVFEPGPTPPYAGGMHGAPQGDYGPPPGYRPPPPPMYGEPPHGGPRYRDGGEGGGDYGEVQPAYGSGYEPAFGRGVYAQRPYAGPGYGHIGQGYGADCGSCARPAPRPAFVSPCAHPCGEQGYEHERVERRGYETSAPGIGVSEDFFYGGLTGGAGPSLDLGGGGGGGGFVSDSGFGFAATRAFSASMSNAFASSQASASASAHASAYARAYAMSYGHGSKMMKHGCNACSMGKRGGGWGHH